MKHHLKNIAEKGEALVPIIPATIAAIIISKHPYHLSPSQIFNKASPSVVTVSSIDYKRDPFSPRMLRESKQGTGTGFVYGKDNYIVTNAHVVRDAMSVQVNDKDTFVLGVDEAHDIAVLKVDGDHVLEQKSLSKCEQPVYVGQPVLAIGNPFGFTKSMTSGIVSGVDRVLESESHTPLIHLLQTDAAINPGNSGGPLLDAETGCVVGMNTAMISTNGSNSGVGFAVHINVVDEIVENILAGKESRMVQLGVMLLPDEYTKELGIEGIVIADVIPGGIADTLGLKGTTRDASGRPIVGDIILAINKTKVVSATDIYNMLDAIKDDDSFTISVLRQNGIDTITIQLKAHQVLVSDT